MTVSRGLRSNVLMTVLMTEARRLRRDHLHSQHVGMSALGHVLLERLILCLGLSAQIYIRLEGLWAEC